MIGFFNRYNFFTSCFIYLCTQGNCTTSDNIYQSWDLSFIENREHRMGICRQLNLMSQELDQAIENITKADHVRNISTILSNARIALLKEDGSVITIHEISRDRSSLFLTNKDTRKGILIDNISQNIFCSGDRLHYLTLDSEAKEDDSLKRSITIRKERQNHVLGFILSERNFHSFILEEPADKNSAKKYVGKHLEDGEGFAVDKMVDYIQSLPVAILDQIKIIYPLFCTERDPCRCCLLSIKNYLIAKIKETIKKGNPIIKPIIVTKAIYHEQFSYKAFRCYYPFFTRSAASSLNIGLTENPSAERKVITGKKSYAEVAAGAQDPYEEDDKGSDIIYLCRMSVS